MTDPHSSAMPRILVAIDVAKSKHDILVELPSGQRKKMIVRNRRDEFQQLVAYLKSLDGTCEIALEPTADYHRCLAYFLGSNGLERRLVSSIAVARTREALHNSWDKNDPKDAQVILHLLRNRTTQCFYDPVMEQTNDLQELSKTHHQVSLRKTRVQHSLMNHYLPLYFPEAERFLCTTRAGWFARLLIAFPTPASVTQLPEAEFVATAAQLLRTKHSKESVLRSFYATATESIGIPVTLESQAVATFRLLLADHLELCRKREELERTAHALLKERTDYQILRSVPGIGPIIALTVLAEAGDVRRFGHVRQFLKFCGLDLSTAQSGAYRGRSQLSKRGNGRLRAALWLAATVASRMTENTVRRKFDRYVESAPTNADLRRKAYTACTAKLARTIYGLIKHQQLYRAYHEDAVPEPDGRTRSHEPLRHAAIEAAVTS
ncbi:MAG: IS110 family transposase [Acidobacteriota bacterium]|nr:IS110 family transposase [Acidobacteriota bacterium]